MLDWEEGDWTVTISGGTLAQEKQASIPIIAYLFDSLTSSANNSVVAASMTVSLHLWQS